MGWGGVGWGGVVASSRWVPPQHSPGAGQEVACLWDCTHRCEGHRVQVLLQLGGAGTDLGSVEPPLFRGAPPPPPPHHHHLITTTTSPSPPHHHHPTSPPPPPQPPTLAPRLPHLRAGHAAVRGAVPALPQQVALTVQVLYRILLCLAHKHGAWHDLRRWDGRSVPGGGKRGGPGGQGRGRQGPGRGVGGRVDGPAPAYSSTLCTRVW